MGSAVRRARTLNILEKLQSTCSSIEPKSVQVEKRVLTGFHKQTSMNLKPLSMRVATHWINTKSLALSSMIPSTPNLSFSLCTQCLKSSLISWICLPKHAHIRVYMSLTVSPLQPFTIYVYMYAMFLIFLPRPPKVSGCPPKGPSHGYVSQGCPPQGPSRVYVSQGLSRIKSKNRLAIGH